MSYSLFINTVQGFQVGLLNSEFEWVDFFEQSISKSADLVHKKIYDLVVKNNITLDSTVKLISVAGPGSYTGIRVSEGVLSVFKLLNGSVFSFPIYLIPYLSEQETTYKFVQPAFKNELFCYSHRGATHTDGDSILVSAELEASSEKVFTYNFERPDADLNNCYFFVKEFSQKLFKNVVGLNLAYEPIYFRKPEDEFRNKSI